MIRIWIGWDPLETIAYHVLSHSIIERSSVPVSISPVGSRVLPKDVWWRERGPHDTTEFSNARFAVPHLAGYEGWALYLDSDMLCQDDIAKLWDQRDDKYAVMCVQHEQEVTEETKGLNWRQTRYRRKNWSSLMLFNCGHEAFQQTSPSWIDYANIAPGLDLHQFMWLDEANEIGAITGGWNKLLKPAVGNVVEAVQSPLPHFTLGGPWFGISKYWESSSWCCELESMLNGTNPCANLAVTQRQRSVYVSGGFHEAEREKAQIGG